MWTDHGRYYEWSGEQNSEEWYKICAFRKRASLAYGLAYGTKYKNKDDPSKDQINPVSHYKDLILGKIVNEQNSAMKYGHETESLARDWYKKKTGFHVEETGTYILAEDQTYSGSPDGVVTDPEEPDLGNLEIKCVMKMYPNLKKDGNKSIYFNHMAQMLQVMWISGRSWCDYVVFCPKEKQAFIKRVRFDPQLWSRYHTKIESNTSDIKDDLLSNLVQPFTV